MPATESRTLVQAIEDAAASDAGYRFIDERNETNENGDAAPFFTHADIERATARLGGALQALGAKKGERVALILPDNADFTFAFLGAVRAGIVPVPIYPPSGLGSLAAYLENALHIVSKSGARFLLTNGELKRIFGTIAARAPALERVLDVRPLREANEDLRPVKVTLDDVCFLQFTSGSTSRPKGVILTHGNLTANVYATQLRLEVVDGGDSGVSWLPLYHDMGLIGFVLAPIYRRLNITFLPPLLFLKAPVRWLEAISRYRATVSFGPNFAYALCVKRVKESELQGIDLSSWRVAGCGAEPIHAGDLLAFSSKFARAGFSERAFVACYGMAESTLAVTVSHVGPGLLCDSIAAESLWSEGIARPVARDAEGAATVVRCGSPFEGHEVRAFGPDEREGARPLAEREIGELRLRGPSVSAGYFNDSELTKEAFVDGWLKTGDLGYLAEGVVHICGRIKDVVIVHGRNYYPQDLEWEAGKVEGVRKGNVVAFGSSTEHADRERVVICFETAVADPTARATLQGAVRRAVQQALGLTVDEVLALAPGVLPKTSSGKLQRSRTRELYESGALLGRTSSRRAGSLTAAKELAKSRIGYLRHALRPRRDG